MKYRTPGFTLIELLIVMAIIGLLAAMVAPRLLGILDDRKVDATRVQLRQIQSALEFFRLDFGRMPNESEGLAILWSKPDAANLASKWRKEGYLPRKPLDAWRNEFEYRIPGPNGKPFDVVSLGADGQPGGDGHQSDLSVWD